MQFAAEGQFSIFLLCFSFGALMGFVRGCFPMRGIRQTIFDFFFFLAMLPLFLLLSFFCRFPLFRPYMAVGVFAGFVLIYKKVQQSVAKPIAKWYNQRKSNLPSSQKR